MRSPETWIWPRGDEYQVGMNIPLHWDLGERRRTSEYIEGKQNMPAPLVLLWQKDYFEPREREQI